MQIIILDKLQKGDEIRVIEPSTSAHEALERLGVHVAYSGPHFSSFQMTTVKLLNILDKYSVLKEIPTMHNMKFGCTQPIFTFPMDGEVEINTRETKLVLTRF